MSAARLLPFSVPDHLLNLFLHRIEVEGSWVLHRRIVDRRQRQFLSWWRIWVRSAEFDRRIFLQDFRELSDDLRNRRDDP
jgi:hypothetical protein